MQLLLVGEFWVSLNLIIGLIMSLTHDEVTFVWRYNA